MLLKYFENISNYRKYALRFLAEKLLIKSNELLFMSILVHVSFRLKRRHNFAGC